MGDIGITATTSIIDNLKEKVKEQHIRKPSECKELLIQSIKDQMNVGDTDYEFENRRSVVLVVGVNGVGKTTSIGKMASQLKEDGRTEPASKSSAARRGPTPRPSSMTRSTRQKPAAPIFF